MEVVENIVKYIEGEPSELTAYNDLLRLAKQFSVKQPKEAIETCAKLRELCDKYMKKTRSGDVLTKLYNLVGSSYLLCAPFDFHSFCIYLEWNRPPAEKFYQPRHKVMYKLAKYLQDLADGKIKELFLSMPPRVGKLVSDNTPVLTSKGWKNHGDLQVGDYVYSPEGELVPVIGVMPKNVATHRVTFSDGTQIECHFRHEWKVIDRHGNKEYITETQNLIGNLIDSSNGKERYRFHIPLREPIEGEYKELPIDPYALGAWLGDGANKSPRIYNDKKDSAIAEKISKIYPISSSDVHKQTGVVSVYFSGLREALQKENMCYSRRKCVKHIPEIYFTASIEQRLQLLAGLLDSDGYLKKSENRYSYTTSCENLRDDFVTLVNTFGWRTSVTKYAPKVSTSGIIGEKTIYTISFNPTFDIPCLLKRKRLNTFSKQRKISIISIEPIEPVQGNCITVFGGMYLVGHTLMPTHNTTLLLFYAAWLAGRNSESSNLYSAFSKTITDAFYRGVLEIIQDPITYNWAKIFPNAKLAATNALDTTINIDRNKRYPSLTCRSLYGTLNGACDCNGILISDDLIGGIEEALNKDRMMSAWSKVDNNLLPRLKESARAVWCGTRWSVVDPAGLRMDLLEHDARFKGRKYVVVNVPALSQNGNSNFDYDYGVGFSTQYYVERRASFEHNNDEASWLAQYMGSPIERSGALFDPADMRFYNGELPMADPIRKFMAVDPAFGGSDYVAAPICYEYEDGSVYVPAVVYDNHDKTITQPLLANAIVEHQLTSVQVEANKTTMAYKEGIEKILESKNYKCSILTKSAPTNIAKEQRIYDKAPEIRNFYFLEDSKRPKEYSSFMQNVFSFSIVSKNKHDDAPDSLAMAVDMMNGRRLAKIEIGKRFF